MKKIVTFIVVLFFNYESNSQIVDQYLDESVDVLNSILKKSCKHLFYKSEDKDSLSIYILNPYCKSDMVLENRTTVWIGGNNWYDENTVEVLFSKPVIYMNFFVHSINNDISGKEVLTDFKVFTVNDSNIVSSSKFYWLNKFPGSEDYSTVSMASHFDLNTNTLSATEGNCCKYTNGRVVISNKQPFNRVVFTHKVLENNPFGVILANFIRYKLPK